MDFIWLKSAIPIKRYDGEKIEFKIVLGPISPLKCIHNNDFGLIFYGVKHTGPDQADFMANFLIITTFDSSGGFRSNQLHFKA